MTVEELNVKVTADISDLKRDLARMEGAVKGSAKKSETAMSAGMKKIGGAVAAAFSVQAVIGFSRAVIEVRSEFEKFEAVLTNTLGSAGAAKLALLDIKDMAAQTPFSVAELSGAFVKLTNYGLQPSMEAMRQYGDLASAVGKGFDQLAESVADATTGEFERLKEFGIKASKQGDKVTFTFKEQATTVDFTTKAIEEYIKGLGDLEGVSGSMAAISETLGGKVSNLGDKWDSLLNTIGDTTAWGNVITAMGDTLSATERVVKGLGSTVGGVPWYERLAMLFSTTGGQVGLIQLGISEEAGERGEAQRQAKEDEQRKEAEKTTKATNGVRKSADELAKELAKATEEASKLRKARIEELGLQKSMQQATQLGQRQMGTFNLRLRGQMDTGGFVRPRITGPEIQYEDTSNLVLSQLQERTFEADEAMFDFGSSASILSQSLVAAAHDTENASDIFRNAIGGIVSELTTQLLAAQLGKFAGPIGGLIGGLITLKGRDLETSRTRTQNSVTRYN
jgi:hypothetical protein